MNESNCTSSKILTLSESWNVVKPPIQRLTALRPMTHPDDNRLKDESAQEVCRGVNLHCDDSNKRDDSCRKLSEVSGKEVAADGRLSPRLIDH